jgi:hypothetical protein
MELKDVIQEFTKHGPMGLVMLSILIIIYAIVKTEWFGKFFSKLSDQFVEYFMKRKVNPESGIKLITESDILNHDIFNYIDFWMYSKVPTFQFSTEYRTIVFRKYLFVYLKKHKENLTKYVNSKEFEEMDSSQIWKSFLSLVNDIIYDYEREMLEQGIPKIIIEKMKTKNNDTISLTIDLIEGICNSQFYNSEKNFLKIYSILNIMLSILENTISNSESVCDSINGQLKGLSMDGKIEP